MKNILWDKLELVIFDVDGTLYDQKKMRIKMLFALIRHYLLHPWDYKELVILHHFRKQREQRAGYQGSNLQHEQYLWVLSKVDVPLDKVKAVINKWIFDYPNQYLRGCIYPGLMQFVENLQNAGISTAVYSDYEAARKMQCMGINVDLMVSSTDSNINAFKPLPVGIHHILTELKISNRSHCLFIGDRIELDGKCAEIAEIPFLLADGAAEFYNRLSKQLEVSQINK